MGARAMTTYGQVQGVEKEGVLRFAGIPYAAAPVGPHRFGSPRPANEWTGVRPADRFGPQSWQSPGVLGGLMTAAAAAYDEDCLTLNIQTSALDDGGRPVMFWIHGGGFTGGTGATPWYNGASFVTRGDVVVVAINYRLGALGFLHLGELGGDDYASSGLNGILDQVAALEWVRDNIAAFGGDPGNVTIFGESAGGMSVGVLLGLPRARGLFHRAIPQSGAASNLSTRERSAMVTEMFCRELGVSDLDGLLNASPQELIDAQAALPALLAREQRVAANDGRPQSMASAMLGLPFQPVLDGVELPVSPLDAIRNGLNADVPIMTGTNLDEWNLFALSTTSPSDVETMTRRLGRVFPDANVIVDAYRAASPDEAPEDVWAAIMTDVVFRVPAVRLAEAQANHQPDHTFMYRFSWKSTAFDGRLGSCHALEIPFVFNNLDRPGVAMLLGDGAVPGGLSLTMHDAWWRFAHTGNPNGAGLPEWPAYDATDRSTMEFGATAETVEAIDDPSGATREAWTGII